MSEWGVNKFDDELTHHGIKGQKWGVRRFDYVKKGRHSSSKEDEKTGRVTKGSSESKTSDKELMDEEQIRREKLKKIAKYVAIGGGVALGAYGLYKLSSINSQQKQELLSRVSAIDKNVSVKGWSRDVQNKLEKKLNKFDSIVSEAQTRSSSAFTKMRDQALAPNYSLSKEENDRLEEEAKLAWNRAAMLRQAAGILSDKARGDLELYKQLDPTGETKVQAAKKVFKSTSGAVKESIKQTVKNAPLTAAARKVEEEKAAIAANAIKEIQKIQVADAKKIVKLWEQDPERFFTKDMEVLDYTKYSLPKLDKLRKLAGLPVIA